jgi:hypothetical protein
MPYDWLTGQQTAAPPPVPGFGPRTPNLVGVRGGPTSPFSFMPAPGTPGPSWLPRSLGGTGGAPAAPGATQYHTYTPTKGNWKLAPGQTLAFTPGKGYYAAGAGAGGGAKTDLSAPKDPWTKLLTQVMGSIETPAQQEARVNREINAQIAAQKKLIEDDAAKQRADALNMFQAQAAAGAAAAAMSKDLFGAVGGEFNAAAGEMKGLAHGLSKNAQGATAGDVAGQNAALGALGNAPLAEGGTFGVGGGTQQGVEEYRGGTLAAQMFGTQGEAANFGLAGMIASGDQRIVEEATATLLQTRKDIGDSQSKAIQALAAGRGDLYHTYMNDARDSQIKYISLAQGIQAAQAAGTTKPITRTIGGNLMQWDPTTRKWIKAVQGNTAAIAAAKVAAKAKADAAKAALPNSALSKVYGHVVDSKGNAILGADGQKQPVAKTADSAKVNLQLSRARGKWVDANGTPIPSLNKPGMPKPPPFFKPSTGKKAGTDKVTREDLQQAGDEIRDYGLYQRALAKVKKFNQSQIAAGRKRNGQDWADNPLTGDEVSGLPEKFRRQLGLTDAELSAIEDPHTLQEVYISLAHALGGRRAWDLIRKTYPKFGQGYYK